MARVLVTGGAGFIGSHLVERLLGVGHDVWVLDTFESGTMRNLQAATDAVDGGERLHIVDGSVAWGPDVQAVVKEARPQTVYHLAAQVDVGESLRAPVRDFIANVRGTVNVLEAAKQHASRFVFVSSAAVFGTAAVPTSLRMGPDGLAVAPISPYGASKAAAGVYVRLYDDLAVQGHHSMTTVTVLLSNVYGPRQRADRGAVSLFTRALLAGEPVQVRGDGTSVRDYLYVADAVDAIAAAGEFRGHFPQPILVGTGVGTRTIDLVQELCQVMWEPLGTREDLTPGEPLPVQYGERNYADIDVSVFPPSRFAKTKLRDGLTRTVEWIMKEGA